MKKTIAMCIIIVGIVFSAEKKLPGVVFLMIWPGARPTSLGGAFTSIANDASATYYNPGGIGNFENTEVTLMHVNWLPGLWQGMYYEFMSVVAPLGKKRGAIGGNVIYITTGNTDVYGPDGEYIGTYVPFDMALTIDYGYKFNEKLSAGLGFKFIYSYLVPEWVFKRLPDIGVSRGGTGITWAFDMGFLYSPFKFLSLGFNLQNIGPNISYTDTGSSDPIPQMLRTGFSVKPVDNKKIKVLFTGELTKLLVSMFYDPLDTLSFSQELSFEFSEAWKGMGLEIGLFEMIFLRVGFFEDKYGERGGFEKNEEGEIIRWPFTYGVGFHFNNFKFDIGIDENIYSFKTTNRKFSLSYSFK